MADRLLSIGRLGPTDHATDVAGMTYVYPVVSRRAGGVSIGVNLNPNAACNWRCVYCQVPGLSLGAGPPLDLDLLEAELDRVLDFAGDDEVLSRWAPEGARRLVDVAFSGDGEPTTSPDFGGAIDRVCELLARRGLGALRIILITNGSLVRKPAVSSAIARLSRAGGEVWFELDSATREGSLRLNGSHETPEHHLRGLREVAASCKTWIQSCFVSLGGSPPSEEEQRAYLDALAGLARDGVPLEGVLLYTLARPSYQPGAAEVGALSRDWLEGFASQVAALGLRVKVA